jgi:hypothetical protein
VHYWKTHIDFDSRPLRVSFADSVNPGVVSSRVFAPEKGSELTVLCLRIQRCSTSDPQFVSSMMVLQIRHSDGAVPHYTAAGLFCCCLHRGERMASLMTALGLEQMRRRKGISLNEIAEITKISTFFLQAIEREEFAKLPGGLFNRSYMRQYADAVGISADALLDNALLDNYAEYEAEKERQENPPTPPLGRKAAGLRWLGSLLAS